MPDDIGQWRKQQRTELLARRVAVNEATYRRWNASVTQLLIQGFPLLRKMVVGIYWPFQGEFDPVVSK